MNFALIEEITAAQEASNPERVDALLAEFLKDIDMAQLPDDVLERYMELLQERAAAVPADAVARMHARFEREQTPEHVAAGPRLIECLEQGLADADDPGELGVDAAALEKIRRDPRPLAKPPKTLADFSAWLAEGGIQVPVTLQQRLLKCLRRGYGPLAPNPGGRALPFQAARKEDRGPRKP